ncbi:MAG TPA: cyclic nucleotide-binding domain-containing protein [Candidatus Kapabacteria bacterium]|nr:cyclic nucleotide-binding domain-containing protein [Candidatus Kapabacteria bacterium]
MSTSDDPATPRCIGCPVLDISIFSSCPVELLEAIVAVKEVRELRKDATLFEEGAPVDGLCCQYSGRFALLRSSGADEHVVAVSRPGHGLGARDLLQGGHHEQTAVALEDSRVCFVPARIVRSLVRDYPPIIVRVMEGVCQNLSEIERQIERHEHQSGRN